MTAFHTENLSLLASAPNGIRRLRELILELGVTGRLVAQDMNDESGQDLLVRIGKLHASLMKGKQTKSSSFERNELPDQLPTGWAAAQLGDVVEIVRGITFPASEKTKAPAPGRIACLRTANVQDRVEWDDLLYVGEEFVAREDQVLQVSDIVMSMANSRELVGKVALVTEIPVEKASFGGFLGVIRPILMEPRFVMALLRTPVARRDLIDGASQTTNIANISLAKLRPLPVAVPPLAEQRRIVAKIDELMALCDRLEARQKDAEAAHARLVQALLDSLTQARDADEFQACWQRLVGQFQISFATVEAVDKLKQVIRDVAVSGRLSAGSAGEASWEWSTLGAEVTGMDSGWSPACLDAPSPSEEAWGVLRTTAVQSLQYVQAENKCLPSHLEPRPEAEVRVGDILFTRAGPMSRVAISCLVEATRPRLMLSDKIIRFRPKARVVGSFMALCLNAGRTAAYLEQAKSGMAASQVNISQAKLKAAPIPVPPLDEQDRIVAAVTELLTLCDQLKARIAAARAKHAQLAEALVAQAVAS